MICQRFVECLQNLKTEYKRADEKTRKNIGKKEKPKSNGQAQKGEWIYVGYPCKDDVFIKKCVEYFDGRSKPKCAENGKSYVLSKGGYSFNVLCMHIDGGVIDDNTCDKCDYALFLQDGVEESKGRAIYIELKGKNTEHAIDQLISTIDKFKDAGGLYKRVYARIVNASSPPRIQNTESYIDLQEKVMELGGNLKTREMEFVEEYSALDSV